MVPTQPQERIGTPFDHDDRLDFHMSSLERLNEVDARDAVSLAYELTPNPRAGEVGRGVVGSVINDQATERQESLPPTPVETAALDTHNIVAMRRTLTRDDFTEAA